MTRSQKTIRSEAREIINHVNHQRKQEAMEKGLILPVYHADERRANHCGVSCKHRIIHLTRSARSAKDYASGDDSPQRSGCLNGCIWRE